MFLNSRDISRNSLKLSDFSEVSGFPCYLSILPLGTNFHKNRYHRYHPLLPLGRLLLELGRGFAFVGSEVPLEVDGHASLPHPEEQAVHTGAVVVSRILWQWASNLSRHSNLLSGDF